jgi:phospholipase C
MKQSIFHLLFITFLLTACSLSSVGQATPVANATIVQSTPAITPTKALNSPMTAPNSANGQDKIKHIIIIMQENRSFDTYFGTFPGANGFPRQNGKVTVCIPDPQSGKCVYPFHDPAEKNFGGPHGQVNAASDINGGKMDGFIEQAEKGKAGCTQTDDPVCGNGATDVMGYHDAREIPNYWT